MYGLYGKTYYVDRTLTEQDAYALITRFITAYCRHLGLPFDMRTVNEKYIPALAARVKAVRDDDYYNVFVYMLETGAEEAGIDPFKIVTEQDLLKQVLKVYDPASGDIPKAFTRTLPSVPKR